MCRISADNGQFGLTKIFFVFLSAVPPQAEKYFSDTDKIYFANVAWDCRFWVFGGRFVREFVSYGNGSGTKKAVSPETAFLCILFVCCICGYYLRLRFVCLDLAMARPFSSVSCVMTEPAATRVFFLIVTGATKAQFEPKKALSSMTVRNLFFPS